MSIQDFEKAIELIEEFGGGDFEGPKDESLIKKAEQKLGVKFPPTYRRFLASHGCGDVEGLEIYGVIKDDFDNSGIPDAIWITLKERQDSKIDANLVLISADGTGSYFAINTAVCDSDGESPVVLWEPGFGVREKIADSFGVYFFGALNELRE
jgi:cell wall assembly regulator SMI1